MKYLEGESAMNKKFGFILILAAALALTLTGCAEAVFIEAGDTRYEVTGVRVEEEYAGQAPAQGNRFLLVQAKGARPDMDQMQRTFFDVNSARVTVSDGAETVPCKSVTWAASDAGQSPDVTAVLLFEVPAGFAEDFTLFGEAFGEVALSSSQSAFDSITGFFRGGN